MKDKFEEVLSFAKEWAIELDVTYDATWAGHHVHRASVVGREAAENGDNRALFWLTPEDDNLCFYVPGDLTAETLSRRYALDINELDWSDVPENLRAACMNVGEVDLENAVYRIFVQYLLNMRAEQLGFKMHKVVQAAIGGCVGR